MGYRATIFAVGERPSTTLGFEGGVVYAGASEAAVSIFAVLRACGGGFALVEI